MLPQRLVLMIVAGAILALPYVAFARGRRIAFAAGLVIAAAVYVPLAAFDLRAMATELAGVVLFGIVALAGVRWSPWLLGLGWLGHVAWDLLLHPVWWYPALCVGFDLVVCGCIFAAPAAPGGTRRADAGEGAGATLN